MTNLPVITFIIPLRSKHSCLDWQKVSNACTGTLYSIAGQTNKEYNCFLVCHETPFKIPDSINIKIINVDFPYPKSPKEFKKDKGLKIKEGIKYLIDSPSKYYMILDADDRIHSGLTQYIANNQHHDNFIVDKGYVYPGGRFLRAHDGNFDKICGSVLVSSFKEVLNNKVFILDGHHNIKSNFRKSEKNIIQIPFFAVIKNVGYGENITETIFIWSKSMKRTIKKFLMLRLITRKTKKLFALDVCEI